MPKTMTWTTLWAGILLAAACGGASGPSTPGPVDMDDARPGPRGDGDSEQEAYADVIGEDAVSDEGVFTVHEVDGDYLFEIPDSLLDRDMLLISRISGVQSGMGGFAPAGVASNRQMIRFERRDDSGPAFQSTGVDMVSPRFINRAFERFPCRIEIDFT